MEQQPESPGSSSHQKSKELPVNKGLIGPRRAPSAKHVFSIQTTIEDKTFMISDSDSDSDSDSGSDNISLAGKRASSVVLKLLADPNVSTIGIYGIAGVGKTFVATDIQNKLQNHPDHSVSWVTVSQNFSIHRLQDDIARTIGVDLLDEDDKEGRVKKLETALEESGIVLILDGLLDPILREDVGIPANCKLVLTTRSHRVCEMMNCQLLIHLEGLSARESRLLFKQNIGTRLPYSVKEIAKLIAVDCVDSPLAIMAMAASMKGVEDLSEWRNAFKSISYDDDGSVTVTTYCVLRYCYERLGDPILQECLLYCASYPPEFKIDREMLIENLIDAGLVDGKNREAELKNGVASLDKLENAFLLEGGICKYGKRYFKMNNLVREFLLSLSSSKLPSESGERIPEDDSQFGEVEMPVAGEAVTGGADPNELPLS